MKKLILYENPLKNYDIEKMKSSPGDIHEKLSNTEFYPNRVSRF